MMLKSTGAKWSPVEPCQWQVPVWCSLGPKAFLCHSREAFPGCETSVSGGLTPGCTGISFEVESTALLSPPGDRKVFGCRGAHILWSWKHTWSCSPPVQAMSHSHCFPSHPHLSPSLRWRAALEDPTLHFPLHYCCCVDGTSTFNPLMQFPLVWLCRKICKNVYFYIQGFFKKGVSLHWCNKKLEIISKK